MDAAAKIQAIVRGKQTFMRMRTVRELHRIDAGLASLQDQWGPLQTSSVKLQAAVRGFLARRRVEGLKAQLRDAEKQPKQVHGLDELEEPARARWEDEAFMSRRLTPKAPSGAPGPNYRGRRPSAHGTKSLQLGEEELGTGSRSPKSPSRRSRQRFPTASMPLGQLSRNVSPDASMPLGRLTRNGSRLTGDDSGSASPRSPGASPAATSVTARGSRILPLGSLQASPRFRGLSSLSGGTGSVSPKCFSHTATVPNRLDGEGGVMPAGTRSLALASFRDRSRTAEAVAASEPTRSHEAPDVVAPSSPSSPEAAATGRPSVPSQAAGRRPLAASARTRPASDPDPRGPRP